MRRARWATSSSSNCRTSAAWSNTAAVDAPESVNADAYANWLFRVKPSNPSELDALLSADAYAATL